MVGGSVLRASGRSVPAGSARTGNHTQAAQIYTTLRATAADVQLTLGRCLDCAQALTYPHSPSSCSLSTSAQQS